MQFIPTLSRPLTSAPEMTAGDSESRSSSENENEVFESEGEKEEPIYGITLPALIERCLCDFGMLIVFPANQY